jgi:hypothetical protein
MSTLNDFEIVDLDHAIVVVLGPRVSALDHSYLAEKRGDWAIRNATASAVIVDFRHDRRVQFKQVD